MTARLITPPAALALSLEAAKDALKIDTADQDGMVAVWVAGVVAHAEHYTGRAFINQAWRVTLDAFPEAIELPHPPVAAVTQLRFLDEAAAIQILDPADYVLDSVSEPAYVVPARGKSWPAASGEINAVTVDYTCGYGATEASVPEGIKLYLIAKLREQYDPVVKLDRVVLQNSFLDRLLDRYMVYA
jgi:uncharacterized phiE125 gp8 family phage protein